MMDDRSRNISEAFGPGADCPSIEDLVLNIEGLRGLDTRRSAESHVAQCAYCETELAMYREFVSPEPRPDERPHVEAIVHRLRQNSPVERVAWWQRLLSVRILAPASLALAAVALFMFVSVPQRSSLPPQVSTVDDTLRSGSVSLISPVGQLHQVPVFFEWQPLKNAAHYKIAVREVDDTPVWQGESSVPKMPFPAEVRNQITPLKTLKWNVIALDDKGVEISTSTTQTFRLGGR